MQATGTVGTVLLEAVSGEMNSLEVGESLLDFTEEGFACLAVANPSCFTRIVHKGTLVGTVSEATILDPLSLCGEGAEPPSHLTDTGDQLRSGQVPCIPSEKTVEFSTHSLWTTESHIRACQASRAAAVASTSE